MVVSVLPSWQDIYCRYLTFVFLLFDISFHTATFLWSQKPSQLPPAAAGTRTGTPGCDNPAHEAEVTSGCCIQRHRERLHNSCNSNRITYSRINSPRNSPRQRASNSIHTKSSRKYVRVKSDVKGPWSYLISWPSWHCQEETWVLVQCSCSDYVPPSMLPSSLKVNIEPLKASCIGYERKTSLVCPGVCLAALLSLLFCFVWVLFVCLFVCTTLFPHPFWLKTQLLTFGSHLTPEHFSASWMVFLKGIPTPSPWWERVQDRARRPCERE